MSSTINASTSSGIVQSADTSGTLELQSNGTTKLTVDSTGAYGQLVSGTAQNSTSGTSIDFTSIPSWVKRITVMFSIVSTNGTSNVLLQLGTSGGIQATGYNATGSGIDTTTAATSSYTTGFGIRQGAASNNLSGSIIFTLLNSSTNLWTAFGTVGSSANSANFLVSGDKTLSATLDRVRITTVNGTDTFDAGSINILFEG